MGERLHILVVDDDDRIRSMLRRYLTEEGFEVSDAPGGQAMRAAMEHRPVDLILLDLTMPGEDGLTLARYVRQRSNVPIIILTGKDELVDRVAGLEAGADDYIAKPFHLREVLARIRTVLRRVETRPAAAAAAPSVPGGEGDRTLLFEGWSLDLARRELKRSNGTVIPLTSGEFELLRVFARHPNRVLSREQLMDLVKGREWAAYDRSVDSQVVRLRKKIEADLHHPTLIKTVRGAGYIFAATVTEPRGSA